MSVSLPVDTRGVDSREKGAPKTRTRTGRLFRRPLAVAAIAVIAIIFLSALLAPLLAPYDPNAPHYDAIFQAASSKYLLGTDDLGRDELSRLLYGGRTSLTIAVLSTIVSALVAIPVGLIAGYYGRWIDGLSSRLVDLLLAFPYVVIGIGFAAILGPSIPTVIVALAIGNVGWLIRIVRGEALAVRERDFVRAARLDGVSGLGIMIRYILPNITGTVIVHVALQVPFAIIGEAALSFLGVGVQPPTSSWGVMLATAQDQMQQGYLLAIVPGAAIAATAFAFNILGDELSTILDPRRAI